MDDGMPVNEVQVVAAVGRGALTADGFPRPVATGPYGRLWLSTDVERWVRANRPAPAPHRKQTRPTSHRGAETRPAE